MPGKGTFFMTARGHGAKTITPEIL